MSTAAMGAQLQARREKLSLVHQRISNYRVSIAALVLLSAAFVASGRSDVS